jgi:hypothetical protein
VRKSLRALQENFVAGDFFATTVWRLAKASGKVSAPCQQTIQMIFAAGTISLVVVRRQ